MAVRCPCGLPAVIENFPVVDGRPFPTLYWLTCVRACKAIGGLESLGRMRDVNDVVADDAAFAERLRRAEQAYVARRDELHVLPGAGGIGGSRSDRVKCLHAHYAHHLAAGDNPVGEWVAERIGDVLRPPPCVALDGSAD